MLRARPQGHAIAYPTIIQTQLKCATSAWTKMLDASSWLQTFGGKPPSETLDIFVVIFLTIYLVSEPRRSPVGAPPEPRIKTGLLTPEPRRSPTGAPPEPHLRSEPRSWSRVHDFRSPVGAPSDPNIIFMTNCIRSLRIAEPYMLL